jgi:putative heme-binding domain-containing protein
LRQLSGSDQPRDSALIALDMDSRNASIRFHAVTASGRVKGDVAAFIVPLLKALGDPDDFVRFAAVTAVRRIAPARPGLWDFFAHQLGHENARVRESVAHIFRDIYEPRSAETLIQIVKSRENSLEARTSAISLLASITRKPPEWKGEWWAYHPALAPAPIKTVPWESTDDILSLLKQLLATEPQLRLTTIRAITEAHDTSVAPDFRQLYSQVESIEVRKELLQSLAAFKDTNSPGLVLTALNSSVAEVIKPALTLARYSHSPAVLAKLPEFIIDTNRSADLSVEAIHTSGVLRHSASVPALAAAMQSSHAGIRFAAVEALGRIGGPVATKALVSQVNSPSTDTAPLAARALGQSKDTNAVPTLLLAYEKDATREAALDALLEIPHVAATDVYLAALGNANPTTRDRARKVLEPFKESALSAVRSRIETMRPVEIAEIKRLYADRPDLTLVMREHTIPTLSDYTNAALNNKGEIEKGRRIFHDQSGVACIKCHTVAGQGNAVGPDMTTIGVQFPRPALIEHILDPSKSVREGYQQVLIETSDDESFAGLIKSESTDSLTILTAQATLQTIPKSKVTSRHNSALSLMPDGLHLGLSVSEFADLIAYLESLKAAPTPAGKQ